MFDCPMVGAVTEVLRLRAMSRHLKRYRSYTGTCLQRTLTSRVYSTRLETRTKESNTHASTGVVNFSAQ